MQTNILSVHGVGGRVRRSDLGPSHRRFIKRKEAELDRKCGLIWKQVNPKGEEFIFGRFNRGRGDWIPVTIAVRVPNVGYVTSH